mmetsp:Transcript_55671/g.143433  ORF Transcript_55671/g.143433 Transcript_55671/m.143433 type:complete len:307 (-) Transcript_55671:500-1420(-)
MAACGLIILVKSSPCGGSSGIPSRSNLASRENVEICCWNPPGSSYPASSTVTCLSIAPSLFRTGVASRLNAGMCEKSTSAPGVGILSIAFSHLRSVANTSFTSRLTSTDQASFTSGGLPIRDMKFPIDDMAYLQLLITVGFCDGHMTASSFPSRHLTCSISSFGPASNAKAGPCRSGGPAPKWRVRPLLRLKSTSQARNLALCWWPSIATMRSPSLRLSHRPPISRRRASSERLMRLPRPSRKDPRRLPSVSSKARPVSTGPATPTTRATVPLGPPSPSSPRDDRKRHCESCPWSSGFAGCDCRAL